MLIHKNDTQEFTSRFDKSEPKTVFILGQIDKLTLAKINDAVREFRQSAADPDKSTQIIHYDERNIMLVRFGLRGWQNLRNGSEAEVPLQFEEKSYFGLPARKLVSEGSLEVLPYIVVQELGQEIYKLNTFTEQDEKNS